MTDGARLVGGREVHVNDAAEGCELRHVDRGCMFLGKKVQNRCAARAREESLRYVRSPEFRERGQRRDTGIHLQAIVSDPIIAREQSIQARGNEDVLTLRRRKRVRGQVVPDHTLIPAPGGERRWGSIQKLLGSCVCTFQ